MSYFFIYLLKASLGISLVYILYRFFLKQHTKFQANRIFLLTFLCLALIYPLLNFSLNLQPGTSLAEGYSFVESLEDEWMVWKDEGEKTIISSEATQVSLWNLGQLVKFIYALGLGIIAVPILTSWKKLFQLINRSKVSYQSGLFWVNSSETQSFSAFNYIFIGQELQELNQEDQERIIKHEEVHARQGHSLDLLFLDALHIIFWFLPLMSLLKREMKDLHEYLADAAVAHQENKFAYSRLLLKLVHKDSTKHVFPLHSFAYSPIKHRINMLLKTPTQSLRYLILPSLMGILLMFGSACELALEPQMLEEKIDLEEQLQASLDQYYLLLSDLSLQLEEEDGFIYPLDKVEIVSDWGQRIHPIQKVKKWHFGIDLRAETGTPVKASASGTVVFAKMQKGGYGKHIRLKHADGFESMYAQLSDMKVKEGQTVKQGEVIGLSGNSGASTGPHLHFEILKDSKRVNPNTYLK